MIMSATLLLAATSAADSTVDTLARSMEAYTQCLRETAGPGPMAHEIAVERARSAIEQCSSARTATVGLAIDLLTDRFGADQAQQRIEEALSQVERVFPSLLDGTIETVPQSECSTGLKANGQCLE